MRKFWRLYRKELKFLFGPMVVLILIIIMSGIFMSFLMHNYPNFYRSNILTSAENPSFMSRYLIRPIISVVSIRATAFIYAALFLYMLLYEHIKRSNYQLFVLSVGRWKLLATKYSAMLTWIVIAINTVIIAGHVHRWIESTFFKDPPFISARASFELIVLESCRWITYPAFLCSLVMVAYVIALSIKRYRFVIGTVSLFMGYFYFEKVHKIAYQAVRVRFPYVPQHPLSVTPRVSALRYVLPWFDPVFPLVVAFMLLAVSFILYEKYSEV